jgi:hypothetical protein
MDNKVDIKYINKDFTTFKADLIEYAKSYFPTVYNDFTQASPGSMFIEMSSYVGDVLSFYLDNQLQETYLQYAKQKANLYSLAYTLGYRPKATSAALVNLDVYQVIPSKNSGSTKIPDWDYALTVSPGMTVKSNINNSIGFYIPSKVDFTTSSSLDDTVVTVYQINSLGAPESYLLKKNTLAISGEIKSQDFPFGSSVRFPTIELNETDIISVIGVTDSSGNKWYEVPYLAQDYILNPVQNIASNYPSLYQDANQVPYILEKIKVDRRFTTRLKSDETMVIEFGPGVNSVADSTIIPNPSSVGVGLTTGSNTINTAYDPTNFMTTRTYGLAPNNTTLTVQYLVGGGAKYNVQSNELTIPSNVVVSGVNTANQGTIVTNNENPAVGGGDGDTIQELRQNIAYSFQSQMRAVTQNDYLSKALDMPGKYGKVAKAYVTKDDSTFANYYKGDPSNKDQALMSMYVLGLDFNGNLAEPSTSLLRNLQTYLSEYRMMTDAINLKPAYIINIGCNFDIIVRPNYNGQDVIARCITELISFFNIGNWEINEPIILSDLYNLLDRVEGVQTVKNVEIINKSSFNGITNDPNSIYSKYNYDMRAANINGIIYPSLDPSIFELKSPTTDIKGRVVSA